MLQTVRCCIGHHSDEALTEFIANTQLDAGGHGTLGLGDDKFGLSVSRVKEAMSTIPSFVKSYSQAWHQRHSDQTSATTETPSSTVKCCYQQHGFCQCSIRHQRERYDKMISFLTMIAQRHRRSHLVRGKNQGPSFSIPHLLLIAFTRTSNWYL